MQVTSKAMASIRDAVKRRIIDTLGEQKDSIEKIRNKDRPMDAEKDKERKIAYIQKQVGVSALIAEEIADYKDPQTLPISEEKKSKAESMQGATLDYLDMCFVDLCRAASHAVARVIFDDGSAQGTGFMISPDLLITNEHVISSADMARGMQIEFNFESDFRKNVQPVTRFKLDPDKFFLAVPSDKLDFAIIGVGKRLSGNLDLDKVGFLPLVDSGDKHMKAMFVNCIQHPGGNAKQLVIRENRILARTGTTLIYGSDTEAGASGAPIFNDDWEVLALHHWGEPYRAMVDQPEGLPLNGNEGIRISAIVKHLQMHTEFKSHEKKLIDTALSYSFRHPSLMNIPASPVIRSEAVESQPLSNHKLQNMTTPQSTGNGVAFTVPLTVRIQLGESEITTATAGEATAADAAEAVRKFKPDPNYAVRKGYNANFLGKKVSLPELNDQQKEDAAKNKNAGSSSNIHELKYNQFSVVMNGKRRIAFFTAVNIDGASVISINRETGKVTKGPESLGLHGAEAREKWYDDDRISDDEISEDGIYQNKLKQFHRGHLVKRTDPSWGTEEKAYKGQSDTFHFTNCAPQHKDFNPRTTRWAGVENWITNTSNDEDIRVSVFSGPIFGDKDPKVDYLNIPKAFWKVVAWVEDGELYSTAIIADQSDLIKNIGEESMDAESIFDDIPSQLPQDYHVTIEEVENQTGLSFGNLKDADILNGGGAESLTGGGGAGTRGGRSPKRIYSFNDILKRNKQA